MFENAAYRRRTEYGSHYAESSRANKSAEKQKDLPAAGKRSAAAPPSGGVRSKSRNKKSRDREDDEDKLYDESVVRGRKGSSSSRSRKRDGAPKPSPGGRRPRSLRRPIVDDHEDHHQHDHQEFHTVQDLATAARKYRNPFWKLKEDLDDPPTYSGDLAAGHRNLLFQVVRILFPRRFFRAMHRAGSVGKVESRILSQSVVEAERTLRRFLSRLLVRNLGAKNLRRLMREFFEVDDGEEPDTGDDSSLDGARSKKKSKGKDDAVNLSDVTSTSSSSSTKSGSSSAGGRGHGTRKAGQKPINTVSLHAEETPIDLRSGHVTIKHLLRLEYVLHQWEKEEESNPLFDSNFLMAASPGRMQKLKLKKEAAVTDPGADAGGGGVPSSGAGEGEENRLRKVDLGSKALAEKYETDKMHVRSRLRVFFEPKEFEAMKMALRLLIEYHIEQRNGFVVRTNTNVPLPSTATKNVNDAVGQLPSEDTNTANEDEERLTIDHNTGVVIRELSTVRELDAKMNSGKFLKDEEILVLSIDGVPLGCKEYAAPVDGDGKVARTRLGRGAGGVLVGGTGVDAGKHPSFGGVEARPPHQREYLLMSVHGFELNIGDAEESDSEHDEEGHSSDSTSSSSSGEQQDAAGLEASSLGGAITSVEKEKARRRELERFQDLMSGERRNSSTRSRMNLHAEKRNKIGTGRARARDHSSRRRQGRGNPNRNHGGHAEHDLSTSTSDSTAELVASNSSEEDSEDEDEDGAYHGGGHAGSSRSKLSRRKKKTSGTARSIFEKNRYSAATRGRRGRGRGPPTPKERFEPGARRRGTSPQAGGATTASLNHVEQSHDHEFEFSFQLPGPRARRGRRGTGGRSRGRGGGRGTTSTSGTTTARRASTKRPTYRRRRPVDSRVSIVELEEVLPMLGEGIRFLDSRNKGHERLLLQVLRELNFRKEVEEETGRTMGVWGGTRGAFPPRTTTTTSGAARNAVAGGGSMEEGYAGMGPTEAAPEMRTAAQQKQAGDPSRIAAEATRDQTELAMLRQLAKAVRNLKTGRGADHELDGSSPPNVATNGSASTGGAVSQRHHFKELHIGGNNHAAAGTQAQGQAEADDNRTEAWRNLVDISRYFATGTTRQRDFTVAEMEADMATEFALYSRLSSRANKKSEPEPTATASRALALAGGQRSCTEQGAARPGPYNRKVVLQMQASRDNEVSVSSYGHGGGAAVANQHPRNETGRDTRDAEREKLDAPAESSPPARPPPRKKKLAGAKVRLKAEADGIRAGNKKFLTAHSPSSTSSHEHSHSQLQEQRPRKDDFNTHMDEMIDRLKSTTRFAPRLPSSNVWAGRDKQCSSGSATTAGNDLTTSGPREASADRQLRLFVSGTSDHLGQYEEAATLKAALLEAAMRSPSPKAAAEDLLDAKRDVAQERSHQLETKEAADARGTALLVGAQLSVPSTIPEARSGFGMVGSRQDANAAAFERNVGKFPPKRGTGPAATQRSPLRPQNSRSPKPKRPPKAGRGTVSRNRPPSSLPKSSGAILKTPMRFYIEDAVTALLQPEPKKSKSVSHMRAIHSKDSASAHSHSSHVLGSDGTLESARISHSGLEDGDGWPKPR